ncbi:MAG: fibronectin type III domain-containing protein, partial [Raineya sp.]
LRGLVCHTADEAGAAPGPDYRFGWGLLNAEKAANVISQRNVSSIIDERTLANNGTYTLNVTALNSSTPLEVTIAWNDPAGTPLPSNTLNSTSPRLVNDLDVRVTYNSTTFTPWILDPANPANGATNGDNIRDNIEKIVINNPVAGATYTITVSHKGTLQGSNPQPYSLIVTGIAANPNAVFADFNRSASTICIGQSVTFTDASTKAPNAPAINSWQWNFDVSNVGGALPATANTQGPHTVVFNQSGTYQVSLTISNGVETDTKTHTIVVRTSNNLPFVEGFENTPVVGWTVNNTGGTVNWTIANVGQASTRSAAVDLWNNNIGTNALFLNAPAVNLQGFGSANFSFYVAHRGYGTNVATADYASLELQASSDCGQTFTTIWSKSGQALATTTPASNTSNFNTPGANDWRLENASIPVAYLGNNSVIFRFRLTDNWSNWIYVDNINITGIVAPPTAPTTLTATAVSQTQINLSWTDNANNETAYKVERSPNGTDSWVEIAGSLAANTNTFENTGLTANTTYFYRVRASNAGGDSPYSNVASATTLPNAPTAPTTLTAT